MITSSIDKDIFTTSEMSKSVACLISRLNAMDVDDNGNAERYHILSTLNEINMLSTALKKHKIGINAIVIRATAFPHYIKKYGGDITSFTKISFNNIIFYSKPL